MRVILVTALYLESPFQSLLFRVFSLKGSLWPVHTTWPALETLSPQGLQNDTPKTPVHHPKFRLRNFEKILKNF